jgi:hypothetical protein
MGQPPDGDRPAPNCELLEQAHRFSYFRFRRPSVRFGSSRPVRMGWNDVPEENLLRELELGERSLHDRGCRLRRARTRDLSLGGERQTADARSAVAGGLADEHIARICSLAQVGRKAFAPKRGSRVLVERRPDPRPRQLPDERLLVQAASVPRTCASTASTRRWSSRAGRSLSFRKMLFM